MTEVLVKQTVRKNMRYFDPVQANRLGGLQRPDVGPKNPSGKTKLSLKRDISSLMNRFQVEMAEQISLSIIVVPRQMLSVHYHRLWARYYLMWVLCLGYYHLMWAREVRCYRARAISLSGRYI